ncbi:hypothetical protein GINT2_000556 [Glugoides intestinalis]
MHIELIITLLCVSLLYFVFLATRKKSSKLFFVGPRSTGKTLALLSLIGLENKTVTTLSSHRIMYKNVEIFEVVPDDQVVDFAKKFGLNKDDKFIFFLKNLEELESFPDLKEFDITFVMWKKTAEAPRKNIIYLEESREKLRDLIVKIN